jgi:uncharacterized protein (DUF58 family)
MEFDSVREYVPGDEIRNIDWNVTARTSTPYVKKFCEERELTVMMAIDVSASGGFGSVRLSKIDTAVEIAAVLMFSALKNNDKVGLLLFTDEIVQYVPPRKGRGNVLRLIRDLLSVESTHSRTDIGKALEYLARVQKRKCVVFLMSDFLDVDCGQALRSTNARHDVVAVSVSDPRELDMPDVGFVTLQDAETGALVEVDTRHKKVRDYFSKQGWERKEHLKETFLRAGIDQLEIQTHVPYGLSLQKFFRMRERRQR